MNWFTRAYRESQARLRRRRRIDFFTMIFVLILVPLLGVCCILYTCRAARAERIRTLEKLQGERIRLQGEQDELSRALAELSSRERIVDYAREKLDMRFPRREEVVVIRFDPEPGEATEPADPIPGASDMLASPAPAARGGSSPIHALTRFFALYVF